MLTVSSISLLSSVSVCKRFSDNAGQNFLPTFPGLLSVAMNQHQAITNIEKTLN